MEAPPRTRGLEAVLGAYALGHVLLATLVDEPVPVGLAGAAGLLGLLALATGWSASPLAVAALTVVGTLVLSAVAFVAPVAGHPIWVGSGLVLVAAGLAGYLLHRSGLVVAGVVPDG